MHQTFRKSSALAAVGLLLTVPAFAQSKSAPPAASRPPQTGQLPPDPNAPKPKPQAMHQKLREYLGRFKGVRVDKAGKEPDTIVTHYATGEKAGTVDMVIVHSPKKKMVGFYVYDFGNVAKATDLAALQKVLLNANENMAVGSFFVDGDQDIGLKWSLRLEGGVGYEEFQTVYYGLIAAVKEFRPEVMKLMKPKDEKDKEKEKEKATEPSSGKSAESASASEPKKTAGETRQRRVKKN